MMRNFGILRNAEITGFLWLAALFCLFVQVSVPALACEKQAEGKALSSIAMKKPVVAVRSGHTKAVHAVLSHEKTVIVREKTALPAANVSEAQHFDMDVLIARLKKSHSIGIFTKLALRSDALDLMGLVKAWRRHVSKLSLDEVRARYNGLLLKVLALLDDDPVLSRDISLARESIWKSLMEVKT